MIIEKVNNKEDAIKCDELLTKLINDERKYNTNIKEDYRVKEYFENEYKEKNNILLVAKEDNDNKIVGYVFCKITMPDNGPNINCVAFLNGLYVEESYRKQGIATKLIEECKNLAIEMGVKIFELNVLTENVDALNLYQKIGFSEFQKKMKLEL